MTRSRHDTDRHIINAGFTMVELIVTITLLSIVAALTTLAVLRWQDWSDFKRENEYAQALYSAAQNQLTEYAGSGYLADFARSLVDPGALKDAGDNDYSDNYIVPHTTVTNLSKEDGSAFALDGEDGVWKNILESGRGVYGTDVVLLKAKAGDILARDIDIEQAHKDKNSEDIQTYWVSRLLGSYVSDKEILANATISIEVAPEDGQVFALLYSDKTGDFTYDMNMSENADHYNASQRRESYRQSFMVGYYGVDTLAKSVYGVPGNNRLKLRSVVLNNDDTLHLSFNHSDETINPFTTDYEIKVYDAEMNSGEAKNHSLELGISMRFSNHNEDGEVKKGIVAQLSEQGTSVDKAVSMASAASVNLEVKRYRTAKDSEDEKGLASSEVSLGELPFLFWVEPKNEAAGIKRPTVHLALDAADIQATSWLLDKDYSALYEDTYPMSDFKNTYSFFRFALPCDNIKCSVKASAMTYAPTQAVYSNHENPAYYEEKYTVLGFNTGIIHRTHKRNDDAYSYRIKNARHLYNIRYLEDVSLVKTEPVDKYLTSDRSVRFELAGDIDWAGFTGRGALKSADKVLSRVAIDGMDASGERLKSADFPSIRTLRERDCLDGEVKRAAGVRTEKTYVIKNLSITSDSNDGYMVNCASDKSVRADMPAGLFEVNTGSITNLAIDASTVRGKNYVGGFAGINIARDGNEMKNLTMLDGDEEHPSIVAGERNVGGIIGFELPGNGENAVSGLYNYAPVQGEFAVGGILGMARNSFSDDMKPAAVGDYISESDWNAIKSDNTSRLVISECENEGVVSSPVSGNAAKGSSISAAGDKPYADEEEQRQKAKYIGGIAGYIYNATEPEYDEAGEPLTRIVLKDCASAPQYKELNDYEDKLSGVYVGGIVGYNHYGAIVDCSAAGDGSSADGYVFGYRYVGGIVGMNIGPAQGTIISGKKTKGNSAVNANNVVGAYYVGGITGVNATAMDVLSDEVTPAGEMDPVDIDKKGEDLILVPDTSRDVGVSVQNWINEGIIIATGEYAGGITGFNAGWIYNCNSNIDPDRAESVMLDKLRTGTHRGDYVGGIAGYNNGIIGATDRVCTDALAQAMADSTGEGTKEDYLGKKKSGAVGFPLRAKVYVSGRNFVGGIVGYNAVDAIVEDYQVAGGSVLGAEDGYFVGGYAGLNVSLALLMDVESSEVTELEDGSSRITYAKRKVHSNPNRITGGYFVGGNVGGNLINLKSDSFNINDTDDNRIYGLFETNNFLGQIQDTHEFVGGFVGYNAMFNMERERFDKIAPAIISSMASIDEAEDDHREILAKKASFMGDLKNNLLDEGGSRIIGDEDTAKTTLYITGEDDNSVAASNLGKITADICVGGVIGYNDPDTRLYIKNAKNATPVVARYAVVNEDEQEGRKTDYAGEEYTYRYSYAGGILGKVEKNTVIDNCSNTSSGSVTSEGTYRGAIAEINEGTIVNCRVGNFGSVGFEYVGGIVGLNDRDEDACGTVSSCVIEGRTVTGKNVVGGIAAENRGCIRAISVDNAALSVESVTRGSERYGVAGVYAGVNCETGELLTAESLSNIRVSSKGSCAGGVTGINKGLIAPDASDIKTRLKYDISPAHPMVITGKVSGYKNVGGVMGINESVVKKNGEPIEISYYKNEADITATNGNAGGIVGSNAAAAVISYCMNSGVVTASNEGDAGGIVALNLSEVVRCVDIGEVKANEGYAGGIAAINDRDDERDMAGLIKKCGVYSPEFIDEINESDVIDDHVIGTMYYDYDRYNEEYDTDLDRPGEKKKLKKLEFSSKKYVGGISAINYAGIEECELRYVRVTNLKDSKKDSCTGLFAAKNEVKDKSDKKPYIRLASGQSTEGCSVATRVNRSYIGGITGINRGDIEGMSDPEGMPLSIVYADVTLNNASLSNEGGACAWNLGYIGEVSIKGEVRGDLGASDIGYGGIAGINGYQESEKSDRDEALISGCTFDGTLKANGTGTGLARIGGIAGINGYNGHIEHCSIGVLDDAINTDRDGKGISVTKIHAGKTEKEDGSLTEDKTVIYNQNNVDGLYTESIRTPYDTASYACVGGIAGDNYGRVVSCDNHETSADRVEIMTFTAVVGGIVGHNYAGGTVEGTDKVHTTTGTDWSVEARGADNDLGNGGIIGIDSAGKNLRYLDNYASVTCRFWTNTSSGGIAGFIDQKSNSGFTISECRNFGDILTNYRAGGMVGLIMYNGINFKDCINYGKVRSLANKAGGFLQYWANTDVDGSIDHCFNHGDIIAPSGGSAFISEGTTVYMHDCVNTGNLYTVQGTGANHGYKPDNNDMVAFGNSGNTYCDDCRDYGNNNIFSFGYATASLTNSLSNKLYPTRLTSNMADYREAIMPMARRVTGNNIHNNYYIAPRDEDPAHSDTGVYFSMYTDCALRNSSNNSWMTDYLVAASTDNTFTSYVQDTGKSVTYNFDIDYDKDHSDIEKFIIYLYNNDFGNSSTVKEYDVKAEFKTDKGSFDKTETGFNAHNTLETGRLELDISGHGTVKELELTVTPKSANYVYFRGFAWVDEKGIEHNCTHEDEKLIKDYGVGFDITTNSRLMYRTRQNPYKNDTWDVTVGRDFDRYYLRDFIKIAGDDRDLFFMNTSRLGYEADISFDATYFDDDAAGMDSFVLYLTNNWDVKDATKYRYSYGYTFTDEDGHTATVNPVITDPIDYRTAIITNVPEYSDERERMGRISNVSITLGNRGTNGNRMENVVMISGFGWIPKGEVEPVKLPYSKIYSDETSMSAPVTKLVKTDESRVKGEKITLVPEWADETYTRGIVLSESDPLSDAYYNDKKIYDPDFDDPEKEKGWNESERINVFKELDPKFQEFIYGDGNSGYERLDKPAYLGREINQGRYKFIWTKNSKAAAYEIRYELISKVNNNDPGTVRYKSDISRVSAGRVGLWDYVEMAFTYLDIQEIQEIANDIWDPEYGSCNIRFYVRGVSPYHLLHEDDPDGDRFDSDWKDEIWFAQDTLPQPEVHLEFTGDNKVVAVLDNPEVYNGYTELMERINVTVGNYVHDYHRTTDNKSFEQTDTIHIDIKNGKIISEPFEFYNGTARGTINTYALTASAVSKNTNTIAHSPSYKRSGAYLFTYEHLNEFSYTSQFDGFTGVNDEELEYNIKTMVRNVDFYVDGELVAEDEKLGVPVAYASGSMHTANKLNEHDTYFTMGLSNLPEDLVGRDFCVRTYITATQDHMMQLGHVVAEGIELNGIDDVKSLTDKKYVSGDSYTERSVYGDDGLNPGYVIRKNPDGTYDVYYSASLECYEKQPDGKESTYQVFCKNYRYSEYEDTEGKLRGEAEGYDIYDADHVSVEHRVTYNDTNATHWFYMHGRSAVTSAPAAYTFTIKGAKDNGNGGVITLRYEEGSFFITDKDGNVYGRTGREYDGKARDLSDVMDLTKKEISYSSYGTDGHRNAANNTIVANKLNQSTNVCYYLDGDNGYFYLRPVNIIEDKNGKVYSLEIRIHNGYAQFSYNYGNANPSDPFEITMDFEQQSVQKVQQAPTISGNYLKSSDRGHDSYTFSWDYDVDESDPVYADAVYSVELIGTTVSGDEVSVAQAADVTEKSYTFTDEQDNWNYKVLRLKVTRVGETNKYDRTVKLPHSAISEDMQVMLRLDTVSIYGVSLNMDENGRFITDDLNYNVVWDDINDSYQREDLAGYVIRVTEVSENAVPVYYPVEINEVPVFESESNAKIKQPIKSGVYTDGIGQYFALIDLSDFDGGSTLLVTVQAIAKSDPSIYADGGVSNPFEIELLTRLATPVIDGGDEPSADRAYLSDNGMSCYDDAHTDISFTDVSGNEIKLEYDNAVTGDEYDKGFVVGFSNKKNYEEEDASTITVNIAAALYDEPGEGVSVTGAGADTSQHYKDDAPEGDDEGMYWNSGSLMTIIGKSEMRAMGGKADEAYYTIAPGDFEAYRGEFAGKWIKLAFMTSKTNTIYSSWTDEDLEEKGTVNYYWIHMPRLILDDIELGDSLNLSSHAVERKHLYYHGDRLYDTKQSDDDRRQEQVALGFADDRNAAGYAFTVKQAYYVDQEGEVYNPVYGIYMCRNEEIGGYDVYAKALSGDARRIDGVKDPGDKYDGLDAQIPECGLSSGAKWIGSFDENADSKQLITIEDMYHEWLGVRFYAQLGYDADSGEVRLVLPDLQEINDTQNLTEYIITDGVLIQTWCRDKDDDGRELGHIAGKRALWSRSYSEESGSRVYDGRSLSRFVSDAEARTWLEQVISLAGASADEEYVDGAEISDGSVSENGIAEEADVSGASDDDDADEPVEGEIGEEETVGDLESGDDDYWSERDEDRDAPDDISKVGAAGDSSGGVSDKKDAASGSGSGNADRKDSAASSSLGGVDKKDGASSSASAKSSGSEKDTGSGDKKPENEGSEKAEKNE